MTSNQILDDISVLDAWRKALKGRGVHLCDPDKGSPIQGGADPALAEFTDSCVLTRPQGPGLAFPAKSPHEARHLAAEAIRRKEC